MFVQSQVKSVSDTVKTLSDTVKTLGGTIPAGSQWVGDGSGGIQFDGNVKVGNTLTVSQGITFTGGSGTLSGVTTDGNLAGNDSLVPTGGAVKAYVESKVNPVNDTVAKLDTRVRTLETSKPAGPQWKDDGSGGLRFDDGNVTVGKALTVSQGIICGGNVGIGTSTPQMHSRSRAICESLRVQAPIRFDSPVLGVIFRLVQPIRRRFLTIPTSSTR